METKSSQVINLNIISKLWDCKKLGIIEIAAQENNVEQLFLCGYF